ncbi:MAG: hypothetical protein WCR42_05030 [bacterium]
MKKILTIIAIMMPLMYLVSCQDPVQPANDQLISFVSKTDSVEAISGLMESNAVIKNNSDKQVRIKLKLEVISLIPAHRALVCMGDKCYWGVTQDTEYPAEIVLEPYQESTKTHFFAQLETGGETGISIIRYKFTPNGDTTKTISYTTTYRVVSGL